MPDETQSLDIIHPCTNDGFKRAFHDKNVVLSFLNTILGFSNQDTIKDVHFLDKEFPNLHSSGRDFIVDIVCETQDNRRFLIVIQNDFQHINNVTKAFTEFCDLMKYLDDAIFKQQLSIEEAKYMKNTQADINDEELNFLWKDIKTVIVLIISNRRFPGEQRKTLFHDQPVVEPDIINSYRMMHDKVPGRVLSDLDARIVLVMLDNFKKTETDLVSLLDKWLYAFKDETLAHGVTRVLLTKYINSIHRVGVNSDLGLTSFYKIMDIKHLKMKRGLERFQRNAIQTNEILEDIERTAYDNIGGPKLAPIGIMGPYRNQSYRKPSYRSRF
jgi:hypothetical protein